MPVPDKEKLLKWVDARKSCLLSSVDDEGFPNTKAMLAPRKREGLHTFYFSTNTSSMRVAQYTKNPNACLYFFEKGRFSYVGLMLRGTMEVLHDPEWKEAIWQTGDTLYYKQGVTDPDYCVLRFTALPGSTARYYSNFSSLDLPVDEYAD